MGFIGFNLVCWSMYRFWAWTFLNDFLFIQILFQVYAPAARDAKFNKSLLERLFLHGKRNSCQSACLFTENFRSCQPILDFLEVHYDRCLSSKCPDRLHPRRQPLRFSAVSGRDVQVGGSYVNPAEAQKIVEEVQSLASDWPVQEWGIFVPGDIAVLSPYKPQVNLICSLCLCLFIVLIHMRNSAIMIFLLSLWKRMFLNLLCH